LKARDIKAKQAPGTNLKRDPDPDRFNDCHYATGLVGDRNSYLGFSHGQALRLSSFTGLLTRINYHLY
jgi:hypothetical protein